MDRKLPDRFYRHVEEQTFAYESELLSQLRDRLRELMDYREGVRYIRDFRDPADRSEIHAHDALICSVASDIPEGTRFANLSLEPHCVEFDSARGVFSGAGKGPLYYKETRVKRANYTRNIHDVLMNILIPRQWDIAELSKEMSGKFVEAFVRLGILHTSHKNRRASVEHLLVASQEVLPPHVKEYGYDFIGLIRRGLGKKADEEIQEALDLEGVKPLIEVSTGVDLNSLAHVNVRMLLESLLCLEPDTLFGVDYVLFSDLAIYYLEGDEIKQRAATFEYAVFFQRRLNADIKNLRDRVNEYKDRSRIDFRMTDELGRSLTTQKIEHVMQEVLNEKMKTAPHSVLEKMVEEIQSAGFRIVFNHVRGTPFDTDPLNREILLDLVRGAACLGSSHPVIGYEPEAHERAPSTATQTAATQSDIFKLSQEFQNLGNASWWNSVWKRRIITKDPSLHLNAADLRIARADREKYRSVFVRKMLISIFMNICGLNVLAIKPLVDENYTRFRDLIGGRMLDSRRHAFIQRGFIANTPQIQAAMLMEYFLFFGEMYVEEQRTGALNQKLPESVRAYFRQYISKEIRQLG